MPVDAFKVVFVAAAAWYGEAELEVAVKLVGTVLIANLHPPLPSDLRAQRAHGDAPTDEP